MSDKYNRFKQQLDWYARNSLLEGDPKADPQQIAEGALAIVIEDILCLNSKISDYIETENLELTMFYLGILNTKLGEIQKEFNIVLK